MGLRILVGVLIFLTISCGKNPSRSTASVFDGSDEQSGIYGGEPATGSAPADRSVVGIYSDDEGGFLCTGTLLSDHVVLTAAHCIPKNLKSIRILFGNHINKNTFYRAVSAGLKHPRYSPKSAYNQADLGLLFFKGGIPNGYQPAALLEDYSLLRRGKIVKMLGFGVNWILPGHNGDKKGAGVLRQIDLPIQDPHYTQTEIQIEQGLTSGTCSGDSGGPSFVTVDGETYFWGVGSRSAGLLFLPCVVDSIYTRVDMYRQWIQEMIAVLDASEAAGSRK